MSIPSLRIFVSSPGDVGAERVLAREVIERLRDEYLGRVTLEGVFWEYEPLAAHDDFQAQITPPRETDVVVSILWSRLGTLLAGRHRVEGVDHSLTGTEFEIEDALEAHRRLGRPTLLIYKKDAEPDYRGLTRDEHQDKLDQVNKLDEFWLRLTTADDDTAAIASHSFTRPEDFAGRLDAHLRALLAERGAGAPVQRTWNDPEGPFRGLQVFEAKHRKIFFGRRAQTVQVVEQLCRHAADDVPFLVIAGMSGTGKSSLVRAGVQPFLIHPGVVEGIAAWRVAICKPGASHGDLARGLAQALLSADALPELAEHIAVDELASRLLRSPGEAEALIAGGLIAWAQDLKNNQRLDHPPQVRLLLVIDQLEELFTACAPEQAAAFAAAVEALGAHGRIWTLATVRSDFMHRLAEVPVLARLSADLGTFTLLPPTPAELGDMIRLPALAAGFRFEEAEGRTLDQRILDDAARHPECLPLVEFALHQLWQIETTGTDEQARDGVFSFAEYAAIGGVVGALTRHADAVIGRFTTAEADMLDRVLLRLVDVSSDAVVRRRVPRTELATIGPGAETIAEALVDQRARLCVADDDNIEISA